MNHNHFPPAGGL